MVNLSVSEVIDLMVKETNFAKKVVEEFIRTLLSTIEDTLIHGESVKMKGFGTFKPEWNESRKSVDEQTGEETVIPGFYKIVFTPENELRELINEPFAHLEPIMLPAEEKDEDTAPPDEQETEEPARQLNSFAVQVAEIKGIISDIMAMSEQKADTEEPPDDMLDDDNTDEKTDDDKPEEPRNEFDTVRDVSIIYRAAVVVTEEKTAEPQLHENTEQEITDTTDTVNDTSAVNDVSEAPTHTEPAPEETPEDNISEPVIPEDIDTDNNPKRTNNKALIFIALPIIVLGCGLACWLALPYFSEMKKKKENRLRLEFLADSISNIKKNSQVNDSLTLDVKSGFLSADSVINPDSEEQMPTGTPDKIEKTITTTDTDNIYSSSRTYNDFLATEKMTVGSQLTKFARRYYGSPDFWVYIYEANTDKIKDPNNIPAGIIINIPRMDSRLVDPQNRQSVEFARQLQKEYLR